ncbi:diacylglycerol kinase family protein [Streptomyces aureus]|uniref:diacylglycerol kinase family protein n=1 Tax=Streptomyces aureus TaxID=193461 RepID=UPI0006E17B6F|nr:diacylglycerol kinase family protein [Streptomyces aureus]
MTSELTLFVNPTAGRGRGVHAAQNAARALRDAGFSVRTVLGHDADDALRRARAAGAAGTGALIAVGGDGMISLALHAVAGTRTPLGIIPTGTGNDVARALGLPVRDPAAAARVTARILRTTGARSVDLGRTRTGGVLVAVATAARTAGGMRICADARLDDAYLDVTVVGDCDRRTLLKVFPRVYKGTHLSHPKVTTYRVRTVTLEAPDTTGHADGEPLGRLPLTVSCVPGALRVPAPAPGDEPGAGPSTSPR